ncbi:multidrug effflux MFS transporter [Bacillus paranthracis]|uniref:multidrug effflux MFS transporter n=1 Tax=Bacillus TaxID=1386 RepID=UPI0002792518|nr:MULTISPECIES: multidrug effflux MFS transporter [Bacillus]EJQ02103.1 drug resistance transporter, Bcr/CflA subfamily [Bacillus cereus AND1407]KFL82083.1 drug resistance transporter, Bcr/CflA subfamily protein [Bacillus cereus]MRA59901.1 Bcr/CflA family efflux MFS transporter [Bacillus thuringiensis]OUC00464.1 Bcr/CflA family drug resistance efflux transporter [Bacillus thuringiensis serovar canadensis]KAB7641276.1 multidrug effflux MFS transporter [Bacillus sp. B4-WWTP-NA-D-NA-NA]
MKKVSVPSLLLMIILVAFPQISETIYTPSLPDISKALHVSNNEVQLTLSVYFAGFALGVFFIGWLSDIIGRRPAMLLGIVVYGVGSFLCFITNSIEVLLVSRFIQAFGASAGSVVTQTILRESVEGHKRHVMFAQISAVIAFTPAIGPLIGGFLDQMFGFKIVFLSLVVMSIGIFLYTFVSLPETKTGSVTNKINVFSVLKRLITNPKVVTYGLLIGGANGVLFSYYAEAPFIFIEYFQLSPSMYGFLGIVVAKVSKRLLATYKPEKIIYIGCLVMTGGAILLSVITFVGPNPNAIYMVVFLVAMFILLLGIGVALPNCLSLALVDFQDVIGTAGALFSLGYYVIVTMTIWGMSQLHTGSLLVMPLYFLAIVVIMTVFTKVFILGKQTSKTI